jgi:hypothetical protein
MDPISPTPNDLPTVPLGSFQVSRLIIGGNPIRGYSHFSQTLDAEMQAYHTVENTVATLLHAEAHGINTMISRGDKVIFNIIQRYREAGGKMQWICQTASEQMDVHLNIREIVKLNPIAIYFHGSRSDTLWREGRFDQVRDYLKAIREAGCLAGIAAHLPEIPRYIEDQDWEIDFYMSCFYNIAKVERQSLLAGGTFVEEPFDDQDRVITVDFIRSTRKPCIAYKILAANRKCGTPADLRTAFEFALTNIKPTDMICVGMFQKHTDQIATNTQLVRELHNSIFPDTIPTTT